MNLACVKRNKKTRLWVRVIGSTAQASRDIRRPSPVCPRLHKDPQSLGNCSAPLLVDTGKWGDAVAPFGGGSQPSFADISAVVDKFRNLASAPDTPRVDFVGAGGPGQPNTPNQAASFADVSAAVDAFRTFPYPFTVPACSP